MMDRKYQIVFSVKEEFELETRGILKRMENSGEGYQYLLLGKKSDLLFLYPRALHYLDSFWLILPSSLEQEQKLWRKFYDSYGEQYSFLVDQDNNRRCISYLINLLGQNVKLKSDSRILDFGCGNGLSGSVSCNFKIIGYDFNKNMRIEAEKRGIQTLSTHDFFKLSSESFDGGIASYVMHMAIEDDKLKKLAEILKPGSVLVANFYKDLGQERVKRILGAMGLKVEKSLNKETRYGVVYVFRK